MKKKKVLLAIFASLCVAASAATFAACQNANTDPTPDPALYAAYQTYAEGKDDPMSYEEWVADILDLLAQGGLQGPAGENGKGVKDINIVERDGKKYFEFVFTDDSTLELPMDGVSD